MKTKQELDALREETEKMKQKLAELTEEELQQVAGGVMMRYTCTNPNCILNDPNAGGFMCAAPDGSLCPACQAGTIVYVYPSEGQLARPASPGRYKLRALGDDE